MILVCTNLKCFEHCLSMCVQLQTFMMVLLCTILSRRYGSEAIEGLTVWGKWDSELYVKHNEDTEGEHGWSHYRSE